MAFTARAPEPVPGRRDEIASIVRATRPGDGAGEQLLAALERGWRAPLVRVKEFTLPSYRIPYGKTHLSFALPDHLQAELIAPRSVVAAPDPLAAVEQALDEPLGGINLADFAGARSAAIAVNDKTRPVPHQHLLPPLLARLEALGLAPEAITLLIATGTHPVVSPAEYPAILPAEVIARYPVVCHDIRQQATVVYLGTTGRGTPGWINRRFVEADLRIVVGNIEPHQFMGFSGGVKSAAIGLAGRATIEHNHAMMVEPGSRLGKYEGNPARQDVEELGRLAGVHFALNTILDPARQIVHALAGDPVAVMQAGIPLVREVYQAPVAAHFDLVIASPGGHPKDINLYQAQKALAHAALVTRPRGSVILVAACPEGAGSAGYEQWMANMSSHEGVLRRFRHEGFSIGPHKAYLVSRDAARRRVLLISEMSDDLVRMLLLEPVPSLEEALTLALADLPADARVGVMPWANTTIPV